MWLCKRDLSKECEGKYRDCTDCVLDKIRAEIAEYGTIWVEYKITDKTKTDKGIERLVSDVLSQAKKQVLDIIEKYRGDKNETSN